MEENIAAKDKIIFDLMVFFYQLDKMLKSYNILLIEQAKEGDLSASSIVFNNSLILTRMKEIMKDHPVLTEYVQSKEFNEKIKSLFDLIQKTTSITNPEGKTNLN